MKCNNTHCKYYVKAKKDLFAKMMGLAALTTDGGGVQISVLQEEQEIDEVEQ